MTLKFNNWPFNVTREAGNWLGKLRTLFGTNSVVRVAMDIVKITMVVVHIRSLLANSLFPIGVGDARSSTYDDKLVRTLIKISLNSQSKRQFLINKKFYFHCFDGQFVKSLPQKSTISY